jgi:hypothetical protein
MEAATAIVPQENYFDKKKPYSRLSGDDNIKKHIY